MWQGLLLRCTWIVKPRAQYKICHLPSTCFRWRAPWILIFSVLIVIYTNTGHAKWDSKEKSSTLFCPFLKFHIATLTFWNLPMYLKWICLIPEVPFFSILLLLLWNGALQYFRKKQSVWKVLWLLLVQILVVSQNWSTALLSLTYFAYILVLHNNNNKSRICPHTFLN